MNRNEPMKKAVAFIGLGAMGLPMASNLLKAGFTLRVYNRTAEKASGLVEGGAVLCESPADAARSTDIVCSMLADDAAVESMSLGEDGILNGLTSGGIHLSLSTISPELSRRLAAEHDLRGSVYLAAPVYGRPEVAQAGQLNVLLSGGTADVRERVQPVLLAMGQKVWDFGDEPGAAHVVKVCGNFMIGAAIEAMGEAFTLAEKNGVSRQAIYEMLTLTVFGSPVYRSYGRLIATQEYLPAGFTLPLGQKDITLAQELGKRSGVPLPLAGVVQDRLIAARAKGRDAMDWACLALEASEAAGLSTAPPTTGEE
ncbi:MAG: NAD(P)-dependent oxidoreductase [Capsulimonadales bacterium]|nr:NAD(P)-dependent oxidoreductase [Capsulimonadales bacterium]